MNTDAQGWLSHKSPQPLFSKEGFIKTPFLEGGGICFFTDCESLMGHPLLKFQHTQRRKRANNPKIKLKLSKNIDFVIRR